MTIKTIKHFRDGSFQDEEKYLFCSGLDYNYFARMHSHNITYYYLQISNKFHKLYYPGVVLPSHYINLP